MGWEPTEQLEGQLKTEIRQKLGFSTSVEDINKAITALKEASGLRQAMAVIGSAGSVANIELLRDYGFAKIRSNSPGDIKAALALAPAAVAAENAARAENERRRQEVARQSRLINERIEGYLITISNRYRDHMAGTAVEVPIRDVVDDKVVNIARRYGNAEGLLRGGRQYIEWYPIAGGRRSTDKRFFTAIGNRRMWYCEGGTHGSTTEWWINEGAGPWTKMA